MKLCSGFLILNGYSPFDEITHPTDPGSRSGG
jgi:hypothetical protein